MGFCSQLWKGAKVRYYLIEKQLAAKYMALVATEASTGTAKLLVRTTYPVQHWVCTWTHRPKTGVAQTTTLTKWSACLLSAELQQVLGPVELVAQAAPRALATGEGLEPSSYREGQLPAPEDSWYTDGS